MPKLVSAAAEDFWVAIQKSGRPPLPEITLVPESGPKIAMVIEAPTLTEAVALSHETAEQMGQRYAVCIEVCDGYVTTDGQKSDAILINLWVEGRGPMFFARRYRRDPFELLDTAGPNPPSS